MSRAPPDALTNNERNRTGLCTLCTAAMSQRGRDWPFNGQPSAFSERNAKSTGIRGDSWPRFAAIHVDEPQRRQVFLHIDLLARRLRRKQPSSPTENREAEFEQESA